MGYSKRVFILVIACLSLLSGCQESARTPDSSSSQTAISSARTASGRFVASRTEHDYGVIPPASIQKCEFQFSNPGNSVLHIEKVEGCCGVVTKMARQDYEPDEQGVLEVTYYARTRPGFMKRQIYVYSSDPNSPKTRFTIQAIISTKVVFDPNELILDPRKKEIPDVVFWSIDDKDFALKQFSSTAEGIVLSPTSGDIAKRHVIHPTIYWDRLESGSSGYLTVQTTHPECPSVNIPFCVLSAFQANPSILTLFNALRGKPVLRDIWILNNYGEDFTIDSVKSDAGYVSMTSSSRIANGYQLSMTIVPPAAPSDQKAFKDTVHVKVRNGPTLQIGCYGIYQPVP